LAGVRVNEVAVSVPECRIPDSLSGRRAKCNSRVLLIGRRNAVGAVVKQLGESRPAFVSRVRGPAGRVRPRGPPSGLHGGAGGGPSAAGAMLFVRGDACAASGVDAAAPVRLGVIGDMLARAARGQGFRSVAAVSGVCRRVHAANRNEVVNPRLDAR
jgi:hypothetical protein